MFNIMKDYTRINLRDFRQNLTKVKDSLASGQAYEVMERNISLGYLIPTKGFKVTKEKEEKMTHEEFIELVKGMIGKFELKDEIKGLDDYMEGYSSLLESKHLKK